MLISDVFQFAREARVWKGVFPLSQMERLADALARHTGEVQVTLVGGVDDRGQAQLALLLSADLRLPCPRCLQELAWPLAVQTCLRPVPAGHPVEQEELLDDDHDVIEVDGALDVQALAEDEILLALPLMACHEHCAPPQMRETAEPASPFAVLAGLRKKS